MLSFGKRGAKRPVEPGQNSSRNLPVQEWLPFVDVCGGVIKRRDGHIVSVLRVEPLNITLKSDAEKRKIIAAVHEALNGQKEAFQIVCVGRPVDLDAYLQDLEERAGEADAKRKRLLREYIRYVAGIVAGGEALEHRYYILLSQEPGGQAHEELYKRSYELAGSLESSGLSVSICSDREVIDLLFTFTHPAQAAYERPPLFSGPSISPQVEWGGPVDTRQG